jgi:hypothetical protein
LHKPKILYILVISWKKWIQIIFAIQILKNHSNFTYCLHVNLYPCPNRLLKRKVTRTTERKKEGNERQIKMAYHDYYTRKAHSFIFVLLKRKCAESMNKIFKNCTKLTFSKFFKININNNGRTLSIFFFINMNFFICTFTLLK